MKNQKTAIVIGAAGFIGYHVAKRFFDEGRRLLVLENKWVA